MVGYTTQHKREHIPAFFTKASGPRSDDDQMMSQFSISRDSRAEFVVQRAKWAFVACAKFRLDGTISLRIKNITFFSISIRS